MATSLITEIPVFVFSSQLREIEFSTDLDKVIITLEDGTTEIFRTTIYAYEGKASLINIVEIIENYMINNDRVFTAFTMYYRKADDSIIDYFNINTVFCTHIINDDAVILSLTNFLTSMLSRRVPRHYVNTLSMLHGQDNGMLKAHCVFTTSDNSTQNTIIEIKELWTDDIGVMSLRIDYNEILSLVKKVYANADRLLSYTIEYNGRFCTYYVVDDMPNVVFTFKNCFNVYEEIYLNAVTTTKTEVNRSMAISQGRHSFYDQSVDKTYEVETAPMTQAEAEWVEQLFMSHSVRLGTATDPDTLPEVIITDSTCEIYDNDEKLHKVKFTWQFVEHRPHLQTSARTDEQRIFTEPYNHTFN